MRLVIKGVPRTAKNSQRIFVNKKTGKPFITSGKSAADWGPNAVGQLMEQYAHLRHRANGTTGYAIIEDVQVKALIYRDRRTGDLDNFQHAIGDALQRAGVIKNDSQIESWDGSRKLLDKANPRIELEITPMETP